MIRLYESVYDSTCRLRFAEVSLIDFEVAVADFMQSRESTRQAVNILTPRDTWNDLGGELWPGRDFPSNWDEHWEGTLLTLELVEKRNRRFLGIVEWHWDVWNAKRWKVKWRRVRNDQRWLQYVAMIHWWCPLPLHGQSLFLSSILDPWPVAVIKDAG